MSADRVGKCPECSEMTLDEWWEVFIGEEDALVVNVDYVCRCRACGFRDKFEASHAFRTMGNAVLCIEDQ